ncbi:MAG: tail fiber domain-containing protein [Bryobacteraceae bacterium]|jgi:hypothetical protein
MRLLYKTHLLIACFLCLVAVASAQQTQSAAITAVPRLVRFAGSFHAPVNQPAGPVGATFAIYGQQEGGTPLWTEDRNVEPDANGNYTVLLGSASNEGVPVELFTAGESRWLQVKFYVPGEVDLPRVLLVSVPYALKAGDADTLGGKPASAYALAGSSMVVQPEASSSAVQPARPVAAVAVATTAAVAPAVAATGTANYIAMFTDATGDVGSSVMYQNATSIGINTTTTLDVLDVAGSITAEVDGGPTSGPALDLRNTPPTGFGVGSVNFYTYPNQTVPSAQWQAKDIGGFTADQTLYTAGSLNQRNQPLIARLTVKGGTGNVGIGTTTPVAPLEVNGNAQVDGNLTLTGSILSPGSGGVPIIQAPTGASGNFSAGLGALPPGTTGTGDTAIGDGALQANTTGLSNTAVGASALMSNTTGAGNTATGYQALFANTTGGGNTASGYRALYFNTTGTDNTASGDGALYHNTTGGGNTAVGENAMISNTTGGANTASGLQALSSNTTGVDNTASGVYALGNNTSGNDNTASGEYALLGNTTGDGNIAIGYDAGVNVTNTSNNIEIGNLGSATDSGVIRIGTAGTQTSAFIAGIWGATTQSSGAVPVLVDSNGNLGVMSSSRRYKEDIQDMAEASSGLLRLRPVTFHYKKPYSDGSQPVQYGLIAEEVAEVYPDLVAHSADGQIETVKYQVLDSMLLNELQKQSATIAAQKEQIEDQQQQIRSLAERLTKLEGTSPR